MEQRWEERRKEAAQSYKMISLYPRLKTQGQNLWSFLTADGIMPLICFLKFHNFLTSLRIVMLTG